MEVKHTPGPWALIWHGNEKYPYPLSVHTSDGNLWVTLDGQVSSEANARLMAAAPELLKALKRWVSIEPQCFCSDIVACPACQAKEAITKATGQ